MLQTLLGCLIIVAGVIIAPLPGPMGLPVVLLGLVMVLRNAYWARKAFIRAQRAHPNVLFPIRRLLRRDPQFAPVVWQQLLRLERLIVPRRWRSIGRWRRTMRRE
jgi:hypothetical protein